MLSWPLTEIYMQMAYDMTRDDGFKERHKQENLNNEWHKLSKEGKSAMAKMVMSGMKKS